jgi:hypothetical protein
MSDETMIALVSGGFGLAILALVVSSLREAAAMKRWPIAIGRVLSSSVQQYKDDAGTGHFGGSRARIVLFRPLVAYEYSVNGQRFEGHRIVQSPGINRPVPHFAQKVVDRYGAGRQIEVRYNPARPAESVLEARVPLGWIFAFVIAVGLLGLSGYTYCK